MKISSKNALFQQWLALKSNRHKRQRLGQFLVEGTSAIDAAVKHGWAIDEFVYPAGKGLSDWAQSHLASGVARRQIEMTPALLGELSERHEGTELLAIARIRDAELAAVELREPWLVLVLDRPKSPGNLGTVMRTATSFDAAALVITGHAADPFDPASVRASVGTLFDLPIVRLPSQDPLLGWVTARREREALTLLGTGQHGSVPIYDVSLRGNLVVVFGNETHGLSHAYREACDAFVHLPTSPRQPSLNVAAAAAITLYEVQRQRRARPA